MRIALAWQKKRHLRAQASAAERLARAHTVAGRLERRFAPLFDEPVASRVHEGRCASLAVLELPVTGWEASFHGDDERGWTYAPEYPLSAARTTGSSALDGTPLRAYAAALGERPEEVLAEGIPPFSLLDWQRESGTLDVWVDGLGQAQLFEYEDEEVWAVTNRVRALEALGIELRPVPEEWAVRFTLGWFPLETTGFAGVRRLGPGERVRVGPAGIERRRTDVLKRWVHPEPMEAEECLALAMGSIEDYLLQARPQAPLPTVGLSGGWDSRAVTAVLRTQGAEFEARVRGHPERFDVLIANQLARIASMPLRIKTKGGFPPDAVEDCRACMSRALLWQGGHMSTLKHKTFLAKRPNLTGGVVNVMGQHSGIGKADFAVQIAAEELEPEAYEEALLDSLMREAPPVLTAEARGEVRETLRASYRAADAYDLDGLHRLHFFYLNEFTRRWGAATVNAQSGVVLSPFLNPDFIRAAYAFDPERIPEKPFHAHITRHHAPEWADVLYTDQATKADIESGRLPKTDVESPDETDLPEWRRGRSWGKYKQDRYWKLVGKPLISEALGAGGWWTAIFDRGGRARDWCKPKGLADALVLSHLLTSS